MYTFHGDHKHIFNHQPWNPEVSEYYIYKFLSRIAIGMVNIAIPLFLFVELKYSIIEVILFYVILQTFFVVLVPFVPKIIEKIGIKHSMVLFIPFACIHFFGLRFLSGNFMADLWLIIVLLAFFSIPRLPRLPAENFFIAKNIMHKNNRGSSMANIRAVMILSSVLAPLVSMAVALFIGFDFLFNIAIVLMLISAIPLLLTHDKHFKAKFSKKKLMSVSVNGLTKNFWIAEFGRIVPDAAIWFIWPIFLFLAFQNLLDIGLLLTISSLIAVIFSHYLGKMLDKYSLKNFFKKSIALSGIFFVLRAVAFNPIFISMIDVINRFLEPAVIIPYEKFAFDFMKSCDNLLESVCARSVIIEITSFGAILFILFIFLIVSYFSSNILLPFSILFVAAGSLIIFQRKISDLPDKCLI